MQATAVSDRSARPDRPRIHWARVWMVIGFFGALLFCYWRIHLWVEANISSAERLSIQLGLYGLTATLGGFAFTFWQLYHTRTVADSTERAVEKIKADFQSLDVVVELSNARNEARRTQENLHQSAWLKTASAYIACRSSLDKCVAAGAGLHEDEIEALKDYQAKFIFAENLMNRKSLTEEIAIEVETLSGDLTEFSSFVNHLEYTIRSRFGGQ